MKNIQFNKYYKLFTLISSGMAIISILLLIFKGLNFGIDFKGGTLIELRAIDKQINISLRVCNKCSLSPMECL